MPVIDVSRFPAAAAGLAGAALNLAGAAALKDEPHAYKPGGLADWLAEANAHPAATAASATAFTGGLAALVPFAWGVARRDPGTAFGATLLAAGAALNALGTPAPWVAIGAERGNAEGLLRTTLSLDAGFNALLGLGLLGIAAGMRPEAGWPPGLRTLGVVAGLASLPVALQVRSDDAAKLVAVAGPLWVGWVAWASVALLRGARA